MFIAVAAFLWLPRSVKSSGWFTKEEEYASGIRYDRESQKEGGQIKLHDIVKALLRWEVWVFSSMGLCYGVGQATSSNFLPSIVKRLIISTPKANLYTVGPNLVSGALEIMWCWLSDRYQQRALVGTGAMLFAIVRFICLATVDLSSNSHAGFFFTYLLDIGTFISKVIIPLWMSTNLLNPTVKATSLGMVYMFTYLSGIISSEVFRSQDAPVYRLALIVTGCFQAAFVVTGLAMWWYYRKLNKRLDAGKLTNVKGMDHNPGYRYAL